jgi:hypothetical protein
MAALLTEACALVDAMHRPALRVYTARTIITMEPSAPLATAVAVADGRIAAVGSLESLGDWLAERDHEIDRRFQDRVLLPGFIEPHLHPYIAGVLLPMAFVTPHAWQLPGRDIEGVRGRNAYLARLAELEAELGRGEWLWTWGFHHLYHGRLVRADLDAISRERPIIVWHRSFHEVIVNSAALEATIRRSTCRTATSSRAVCKRSFPRCARACSRRDATAGRCDRRERSCTRAASRRSRTAPSAPSISIASGWRCASRAGTTATRPSEPSCSPTVARSEDFMATTRPAH